MNPATLAATGSGDNLPPPPSQADLFEAAIDMRDRCGEAISKSLVNAVRCGMEISATKFETVNGRPCLVILAVGEDSVNECIETLGLGDTESEGTTTQNDEPL